MVEFEHVACRCCGGRTELAFDGSTWSTDVSDRSFQYRACLDCGAVVAHPMPTAAELDAFYAAEFDYESYARKALAKRVQGWHRYVRVRSVFRDVGPPPAGTWIDVGCGHGWFLRAARRDGHVVFGVERASDLLRTALSSANVPFFDGSLEELELPDRSASVVTFWHSLEHMLEPAAALAKAAALLAPGGYCVIGVPNHRAAGLEVAGLDWTWLQSPLFHPHGFTHESVRRILPAALEEVLATSRDTWDQQLLETVWPTRETLSQGQLFGRIERFARKRSLSGIAHRVQRAERLRRDVVRSMLYLGYLAARRLPPVKRYEDELRGSELVVFLRKR